jgi:diguanylate cyclase (GGDEF)-like protein/putative nucleotidyltransferase with HDIG domain
MHVLVQTDNQGMGRGEPAQARASRGAVPPDPAASARFLAYLFAVGASLGLIALALPHPAGWAEISILALIATVSVVAAVLWVRRAHLSLGVLQPVLAVGSIMISLAIHWTGAGESPFVLFYIWVPLYAFYYFTPRQAMLQLAVLGLAYAAVPGSDHAVWWLVTMGTMAASGGLILLIKSRIGELVARLEETTRSDPLTGVLNRRGFGEALELELERARRNRLPLCLLLGDLDHFKTVNDVGGHAAGDAALRRVAAILAEGKRRVDTLARFGGEEFVLLLPDTDEEGGLTIAERLRLSIRETFAESEVPLRISFGIAVFPHHAETGSSLMRTADEALYRAKHEGRDRSVLHNVAAALAGNQKLDLPGLSAEQYLAVVLGLAEAIDLRLTGSVRHSESVARYAEAIARVLGLPADRVERVRLAGILHDIGKVGMPEAILRKPGELSPAEWEQVRKHPELGAQILDHGGLEDLRDWVGAHHERPDGRGYPEGLSADRIPLESRILAVADSYEAMLSDRPYSPALDRELARAELLRCAGSQFDPQVVHALLEAMGQEPMDAASGAQPASSRQRAAARQAAG